LLLKLEALLAPAPAGPPVPPAPIPPPTVPPPPPPYWAIVQAANSTLSPTSLTALVTFFSVMVRLLPSALTLSAHQLNIKLDADFILYPYRSSRNFDQLYAEFSLLKY
jgi:hypothetical protein